MTMFSIIMAGGMGTRFWPASRASLPKQFLKVIGSHTLLQETVKRVSPISRGEDMYIVVNQAHEALARQQLAGYDMRLLSEPASRNTAGCIGLAALHLRRRDPDMPIVILPADHHIGNDEKFRSSLLQAAELARSGCIVTLGVTPTRPETGYGYIQTQTAAHPAAGGTAYTVERFVEKPDLETAIDYLADGSYVWNSGIFAVTARRILSEIECQLPHLYSQLEEIDQAIDTPNYESVLGDVYPNLESISIDYGVMERTMTPMYALKTAFEWSDVGSWRSLYDLRSQSHDEDGNLFHGDSIALESKNNFLYSVGGRTISLLGVDDLIVVDTQDTVFVARIDRSQDLRKMISRLMEAGRADLC
jgi:mannose-1-phosphate guanylyltransferase